MNLPGSLYLLMTLTASFQFDLSISGLTNSGIAVLVRIEWRIWFTADFGLVGGTVGFDSSLPRAVLLSGSFGSMSFGMTPKYSAWSVSATKS